MNNTEKVLSAIMSMSDYLLSVEDIIGLTGLNKKQIYRAVQTLKNKKIIFSYTDKNAGIGRGRGKKTYYGVK